MTTYVIRILNYTLYKMKSWFIKRDENMFLSIQKDVDAWLQVLNLISSFKVAKIFHVILKKLK